MKKSDLKTGMIVTLRRGVERVLIGECLVEEGYHDVDCTNFLSNYNDDLTYINNCTNEDIMKIEYGGKVIWERVDWNKVPFGTKVRAWDGDDDDKDKVVGKFLDYDDKDNEELPFFIFIKDSECEAKAWWFKNCEIIKEGEDE